VSHIYQKRDSVTKSKELKGTHLNEICIDKNAPKKLDLLAKFDENELSYVKTVVKK